jgi:hypothetical protein
VSLQLIVIRRDGFPARNMTSLLVFTFVLASMDGLRVVPDQLELAELIESSQFRRSFSGLNKLISDSFLASEAQVNSCCSKG